MRRDHLFFGFVLGVVVPLLGISLLYTLRFMPQNVSPADFIYLLQTNRGMIPKVISLGMLACIPLITYYKNRRCYDTLKGVFAAIILYTLLAVLYKFRLL